ncbi:MAG: hypothetical protein K6A98_06770 [Prevotella sp.]|nr:hypothetical protein [Prevotella sp.]
MRFPHHCHIYRIEGETNVSDGNITTLYDGPCRKEPNATARVFKTYEQIKGDYRVSLPGHIRGILTGDNIDITDSQGSFNAYMIIDAYAGSIGTTVWISGSK